MKNFVISLFFAVTCNTLNAQDGIINWYAEAGITSAKGKIEYKGQPTKSTAVTGFTAQIKAEAQFEGNLYFTPNIGVSQKGFAFKGALDTAFNYKFTYIDLSPELTCKFYFSTEKNSLNIFAGPQLHFTNFGTKKTTVGNTTNSEKIKFGFGSYGIFDFSLRFGAALQLNKFLVAAAFTSGFANINNDEVDRPNDNYRNRMISVTLGYRLN
jgi:Outer membrane protein beta-barrel domain